VSPPTHEVALRRVVLDRRTSLASLRQRVSESPGALGGATALATIPALALEPHAGVGGEMTIAAWYSVVLIAAARSLPTEQRYRAAGVVVVASAAEVLCSVVIGLYSYRRGGIPAFVPPGHGLIYLAAWCLSSTACVRQLAGRAAPLALVAVSAWAVGWLLVPATPDVAGAIWALTLCVLIVRGHTQALFACAFIIVTLLELYGTALGTWTWAPAWPGLEVPMANPPSGVAVGYCLFDAAAVVLAPRLALLAARARHSVRQAYSRAVVR